MVASGRGSGCPQYPKRPKVGGVRSFPKGRGNLELESRMNMNNAARKYPPRRIVKGCPVVKGDFPVRCGNQRNLKGFPGTRDFPVRSKIQSLNHSLHFNDHNESIIEDDVKLLEVYNGICNYDRGKVKETLDLFQEIFYLLMQEQEQEHGAKTGILIKAALLLQEGKKWINTRKILGSVPGVEVGDMFQWRCELNVIGLHQQYCKGIDYMEKGGIILATSVVESGRYANDRRGSCSFLIYSGEGGNPKVNNCAPDDQKLERGNLALKNSMDAKTPVRVICGVKSFESCYSSTSVGVRKKNNVVYVYDGLYFVDRYWQEIGPFGKLVFKFLLIRSLGQKKCELIEMRGTRQSTFRFKKCTGED